LADGEEAWRKPKSPAIPILPRHFPGRVHLRWDVEEDLSRVVGDIAAHRMAQAGRAAARGRRGRP